MYTSPYVTGNLQDIKCNRIATGIATGNSREAEDTLNRRPLRD